MNRTLNSIGIDHWNTWHMPELCEDFCDILGDKIYGSRIKIITAVREPISQNLSMMYQMMEAHTYTTVSELIKNTAFLKNSSNVQKIFDEIMEKYLNYRLPIPYGSDIYFALIQNFYARMNSINVFFPLKQEFDKNAGFSIYKQGNIEIFVYQLEKLNVVWTELCDWLKIAPVELKNDNVGDDKWYASSYQQAKREIKITQEYFDRCYSEPYVKHFYSEEDIEQFKNKWESHILRV